MGIWSKVIGEYEAYSIKLQIPLKCLKYESAVVGFYRKVHEKKNIIEKLGRGGQY